MATLAAAQKSKKTQGSQKNPARPVPTLSRKVERVAWVENLNTIILRFSGSNSWPGTFKIVFLVHRYVQPGAILRPREGGRPMAHLERDFTMLSVRRRETTEH